MMGDNVIPVDFGRTYNEAARALATLVGRIEEDRAAILADPAAFVEHARAEIGRIRAEMEKAKLDWFNSEKGETHGA